MARRKTKKGLYRTKKYRRKFRPRETNIIFKRALEWQIPQINLATELRLDNIVEDQVIKLLENKGIEGEPLKLYLACYRDLLNLFRKFSGETLKKELEIHLDKWVTRGLDKEIINLIIDEIWYKAQGYKLYDEYKEFALMIDYLRLKVFGTADYPNATYNPINYILILPVYYRFSYSKFVKYETLKTITIPKPYYPDKVVKYQTQYKVSNPNTTLSNFITYQLNISYG